MRRCGEDCGGVALGGDGGDLACGSVLDDILAVAEGEEEEEEEEQSLMDATTGNHGHLTLDGCAGCRVGR